ncbi:MAG: cob(I)yrinic acid a,c-diamide adenosyltransferase [Planctomycetes bacterium]|nr:cob(I)yrinic acid a,c-diamide adenosyltransferase [Planctomycetota bacterium]MBI3846991.1 cob(I)yrinic acid a,c-diamide adenosyltransferase [Planctomycetota bacterium]
MRITKVYTKIGDGGETQLVGGLKVSKASPRVKAYGDVDELNSLLGVALAWIEDIEIRKLVLEIQNELFTLGADLASPPEVAVPRIEAAAVTRLEKRIDALLEELPPLKEFILPGGRKDAAFLHLARAVARRAERHAVHLATSEPINRTAIVYLNRLSDLLFVIARTANVRAKSAEVFVTFPKRKK